MASILSDIQINPTLKEANQKATVVLMGYAFYDHLYEIRWPEYIRETLFGSDAPVSTPFGDITLSTKKHSSLKDVHKYTQNFEQFFQRKVSNFHVDTFREEIEHYFGLIFSPHLRMVSDMGGDNVYYFVNNENDVGLIVSFKRIKRHVL